MRIAKWETFQGYQKTGPKWIKLHAGLIDKPEWMRLPLVAKAVLPMLWIAASRSGSTGELPDEPAIVAMLCHMKESEVLEALPSLTSAGFIECEGFVADHAKDLSQAVREECRPRERERERREEPVPPAREDPESVDAESTALSAELTEALKQASAVTGISPLEILADAKVRGKAAPITNPGGCTVASRKLWRIAIERVGGFVAAWKSDRKSKASKRTSVPAFDRGLDHEVPDEDLTAWDPRLGPRPTGQAPSQEAPKKPRPALTLTVAPGACPVCSSPLRHTTEGGETVLRCDQETVPCEWAAVWRSVAA